jgi:hypothetical protein
LTPRLRALILRAACAARTLAQHRTHSIRAPAAAAAVAAAAAAELSRPAAAAGVDGHCGGGGSGPRDSDGADSDGRHAGRPTAWAGGAATGEGGPWGGGDLRRMAAEIWEEEEEWGYFSVELDGETQVATVSRVWGARAR